MLAGQLISEGFERGTGPTDRLTLQVWDLVWAWPL